MTRIKCKYSRTYNNSKKISDNFCIYASNDFDNMPVEIAKANRSGNAVVKVVGQNLPRLADWTIEFEGEWKYSKKYHYTFYASKYELISPSTLRGIVRFLSSKTFPGVGEKTAEAIVKEFKDETLDVIEKSPNLLLKVEGVNIEKVGIITKCYQQNIAYSKLCSYLATFSISSQVASVVYDYLGSDAIKQIKDNPYILQGIKGIGFYTCEKIARYEGSALDSNERIEGATKEVLISNSEFNGDMFMYYEEFETKALSLLNNSLDPNTVSIERLRNYIKLAVKQDKVVFRASKFIFLKEYDEAEVVTAKKITRLLEKSKSLYINKEEIAKKLDDYVNISAIRLSENQKQAVINSLLSRIAIITGCPGTGKTTILKAIIEVFKKLYPSDSVTLLAPTGKAARRMSETTGYPASTVHSKLQIYDENKQSSIMLEHGLIVVDEASMLDALLFEKLLKAINTRTSSLILIGDINQLPSVGAGLVLKDLIRSECIPVFELKEIFRQKDSGSTIVNNANKVNLNENDLEFDETFEFINVRNENDAIDKIKEVYKEECDKRGIDNVALLSPLRRTQNRFICVSDGLNSILQDEIIKNSEKSIVFNGVEYRLGDRVLQWRNTKDSANGDIGTVADIIQTDDGVFVKIDWENGNITQENRETMTDISLAYAISIYKSQGSEYDSVIIPLLSNQICRLFKSNLLYTGITRAKKKLILVCDGTKALDYCISNGDANNRKTLLSARIRCEAKQRTT